MPKPNPNLASRVSEEDQKNLVVKVCQDYVNDRDARSEWDEKQDDWYKLSIAKPLPRQLPFENAANVCAPLVASAVLAWSSRAYNAIFDTPDSRIVAVRPTERNDVERASKAEELLNWQLINDIPDYEAEFDKLLLELATFGT